MAWGSRAYFRIRPELSDLGGDRGVSYGMSNNETAAAFTSTGMNLWQPEQGIVRSIHTVSEEAARWDGTSCRFAVYSDQYSAYSYCTIKVTGRKVRWDGNHARLTVQVTFENDGEPETVKAEIMNPTAGEWFDMADAKALLEA